MLLGVNIDHVATLRQARYATMLDSPNAEPSPLWAARQALLGGADSITLHVRADRRHMQDSDAWQVRREIELPLNLEMGNTPEMLEFALALKPDFVCLVPETREEITTEGGLDVVQHFTALSSTIKTLRDAGIKVSLFIDPLVEHVRLSARLQADMVELHTGCFANNFGEARQKELARLSLAARSGYELGLQVNAGHGINYGNVAEIVSIAHLSELNIGHSIVARSLELGFAGAVAAMKQAICQ